MRQARPTCWWRTTNNVPPKKRSVCIQYSKILAWPWKMTMDHAATQMKPRWLQAVKAHKRWTRRKIVELTVMTSPNSREIKSWCWMFLEASCVPIWQDLDPDVASLLSLQTCREVIYLTGRKYDLHPPIISTDSSATKVDYLLVGTRQRIVRVHDLPPSILTFPVSKFISCNTTSFANTSLLHANWIRELLWYYKMISQQCENVS